MSCLIRRRNLLGMTRTSFITVTAIIATAVGLFALIAPNALLVSKGVSPNATAAVWVREVGVLLIAFGVMAFLVREEPDSNTLRGFLFGNALLHAGLLPIEIAAYAENVIARLSGIVPNTALHVVLAGGFLYFALTMRVRGAGSQGASIKT